jgi:hypothetical protein
MTALRGGFLLAYVFIFFIFVMNFILSKNFKLVFEGFSMKKIGVLIGILAFVGLTGCEEKETGLQKKVLNAAVNDCKERLTNSLKSPSSLKLGKIFAITYMPKPEDVYRVDSRLLINSDGKITSELEYLNVRYRELGINIEYEAQNSFGVYLKDNLSCSYIYRLTSDETSPKNEIKLSLLENKSESVKIEGTSIPLDGNSNFKLNTKYDRIMSNVSSQPTDEDKELLKKVVYIWNTDQVFKNFSTGTMTDGAE